MHFWGINQFPRFDRIIRAILLKGTIQVIGDPNKRCIYLSDILNLDGVVLFKGIRCNSTGQVNRFVDGQIGRQWIDT